MGLMDLLDAIDAPESASVSAGHFERVAHTRREDSWDGYAGRSPMESPDLTRILNLPSRPVPSKEELDALADTMTELLRRDNPACECAKLRPEVVARGQNPCITRFRPLQAWALAEAAQVNGCLGAITVGGGKTGLNIFLVMVARFTPREGRSQAYAVLLIPPDLRVQFARDYQVWAQHFKVPNLVGGNGPFYADRPCLEVLAYSELSHERCSTWLISRQPDIVVADEVQALSDMKSVRTGRFMKYMERHRGTRFFCHSGSISTRSIEQFTHLAALSLGMGSPLPINPDVARSWAGVLDPVRSNGFRSPPGALSAFCKDEKEDPRVGFSRRFIQTPGVVATSEETLATRLVVNAWKPPSVPKEVRDALKEVRSKARRPDGEELVDALQVSAVCLQLASGFYYRWKFPRGEPKELIDEWFLKRQEWFRELRQELQGSEEGADSPKLLRDAAVRYWSGYRGPKPTWASHTWKPWAAIKDKVYKETETVWVSDWLAEAAAEWAHESPGIVWYRHAAFGARVAQAGRLPLFGQDADEILLEHGDRSIVASMPAHHKGKNLQSFRRNLVAGPWMDWHQLLGRTHRPGQPADTVITDVAYHTRELRESFAQALERAHYARDLLHIPHKLLLCEMDETLLKD